MSDKPVQILSDLMSDSSELLQQLPAIGCAKSTVAPSRITNPFGYSKKGNSRLANSLPFIVGMHATIIGFAR